MTASVLAEAPTRLPTIESALLIVSDLPGQTVAGYPAVGRMKWLRGLARVYRKS
jgi:hypothetical protein